jgi:glycosyltransferase involved in cell wall biosynthesis
LKTVIIGGFVDYQIQLAKALNKTGDTLVVVYALSRLLPEENLKIAGDRVRLRVLARDGPIYNPVALARFLWNCARTLGEIRRFGPDVVHFQIGSSMLALLMLFLKDYPLVTTFHDVAPHAGEEKVWERRIHAYIRERSRQLMVHGKKLKRLLEREYGMPPEKVNSIPIGPHNVDAFLAHRRTDLPQEEHLVMFFGRILAYKGLEYLIKAEPLITQAVPDATIVVAGAGEDMSKYEAMMTNRDRFILYNHHISYEEGAILFQRCSVLALPYVEASQSGVVSTAYGFSRPVVVTATGAIPEIVDDGVTGYIVPPRDHVALANAIIRILKDPAHGRRMGINGHRKLYSDLSWDNVVRETMVVYHKAVPEMKDSLPAPEPVAAASGQETPGPAR